MATNLKYSLVVKNAQEAVLRTTLASNALINLYSGTQPTNPDTAITSQVLLATLTCSATFGTESGGIETLNAITAGTGTASAGAGTAATWFRITTSGGTAHIDGTVGTTGCDLNLTGTTTIATGQQVSVSSWTFANGN